MTTNPSEPDPDIVPGTSRPIPVDPQPDIGPFPGEEDRPAEEGR